jgi:hypothetical protein
MRRSEWIEDVQTGRIFCHEKEKHMIAEQLVNSPNENEAGTEFYSDLASAANQAIARIYNTTITPIQYPSQGDFNWFWQNPSQVFNNGTFNYISANVSPGELEGTMELSPAGGFPNSYVRLLSSMAYTLSATDQAAFNTALLNAQVQAGAVVSTYQGSSARSPPTRSPPPRKSSRPCRRPSTTSSAT